MKRLLKGLFKTLWIILKYTLKLSLVVLVFFMDVIAETDTNRPGDPEDETSRQREYNMTGFDTALTNPNEKDKPLIRWRQ